MTSSILVMQGLMSSCQLTISSLSVCTVSRCDTTIGAVGCWSVFEWCIIGSDTIVGRGWKAVIRGWYAVIRGWYVAMGGGSCTSDEWPPSDQSVIFPQSGSRAVLTPTPRRLGRLHRSRGRLHRSGIGRYR